MRAKTFRSLFDSDVPQDDLPHDEFQDEDYADAEEAEAEEDDGDAETGEHGDAMVYRRTAPRADSGAAGLAEPINLLTLVRGVRPMCCAHRAAG